MRTYAIFYPATQNIACLLPQPQAIACHHQRGCLYCVRMQRVCSASVCDKANAHRRARYTSRFHFVSRFSRLAVTRTIASCNRGLTMFRVDNPQAKLHEVSAFGEGRDTPQSKKGQKEAQV